jgi:transcriptional regulator with XRE-family HTH domain
MTFAEMFREVCQRHPQKTIAHGLGCSVQYVSDLVHGRRLPSVAIVNAICEWMGRGPKGRLEWHQAGARAHGWEV